MSSTDRLMDPIGNDDSPHAPSPGTPASPDSAKQAPTTRLKPQKGGPIALKTFVLDTNVLVHNPKALFVFEDNDVVVPFTVLEELDRFKGDNDDRGRSAREAIRYLDRLRNIGRLDHGVSLGNGTPALPEAGPYGPTGTLRVEMAPEVLQPPLSYDKPDDRIIGVALAHQTRGESVVFVSKDINCRIKSDALGLTAEDFENQKVDVDQLYSGYCTLRCEGAIIDELYSQRVLAIASLKETLEQAGLDPDNTIPPNGYALLIDAKDDSHTGLARRIADTDHLTPIAGHRNKPVYGIMARNVQQTMALDLLMDDDIRLISLIGSAGTGKTLLALAAGMSKTFGAEARYDKLLVARPIMPMGRDIGYLPGDKDEKLVQWMQPIFDNLTYLMSTRGAGNQHADSQTAEQRINKMVADGKLVMEALTYIRGRSIPHQFMIVDEAQNLSPHEVKTIVSRVGEGTKLVFTGDIDQIDNPYLDSSSNGLSYLVERMRGSGIVGHITLAKSERSDLASLATERL
ncbi:MAG: PhoH family protein [Planctomycetota bacterium]